MSNIKKFDQEVRVLDSWFSVSSSTHASVDSGFGAFYSYNSSPYFANTSTHYELADAADLYGYWNLKTNNIQRKTIQSGNDFDLVAGTETTIAYSAGGVVTINSTTHSTLVPYTGANTNVNLGTNSITAASFIKNGGTSTQFLKADGSIDSNTYLTSQTDSQTLTWTSGSGDLEISNGNTVNLDGRYTLSANTVWDRDNGNGYIYPRDLTDKVGIGTSTPTEKLHIESGNILFTDINSRVNFNNTGNSIGYDGWRTGGYVDLLLDHTRTGTPRGIQMRTNNTDRLFLDDVGNVGIGEFTFANKALAKLHISGGTGSLSTGIAFGDGDTGIFEAADDILYIHAGGIMAGGFTNTGFFSGNGNTGNAKMERTIGSSTTPAFSFIGDGDTGVGRAGANQLSLIAGGEEIMRLSENGTSANTAKVTGDLEITNNLIINPGTVYKRWFSIGHYNHGSPVTGTMVITANHDTHSMAKIKISGWEYDKSWDIIFGGYMRNASWDQYGEILVTGSPPFDPDDIRLAYDSGLDKHYIFIGTTSTVFGYYTVVSVDIEQTYADHVFPDWGIDVLSTEPTVTNTANPIFSYYGSKVRIPNIDHETTDTDKFIVSNGGYLKYRTGAEVLSDIGATNNTGTVTRVRGTGTKNGLTLTGDVTGDGYLTLGGTLANIANSQLINSGVTIGTTFIELGASTTTLTNLANITSTTFTGDLTGNSDTATAWETSRTITLGGDLSGNVSIDGSANVTLTSTIVASSVEASMLNDNIISGQGELTTGLASTDELMISDTSVSTIKRMDISVLTTYMQNNLTFTGSTNGSVTNVATGTGLTGGPITTTGTISHLTTTGYRHIPSGGAANQVLGYASDGTANWITLSGSNIMLDSNNFSFHLHLSDTDVQTAFERLDGHQHDNYDNYADWNLYVNGNHVKNVGSAQNVKFIGGTDISLSYASDLITINSTFTETSHADVVVDGDFAAQTSGFLTKVSSGVYSVDNSTYSISTHTHTFASITSKPTVDYTLSGDVSGTVSVALGSNVSITTVVANDSHTHIWSNITSTPTTLSGYGITDNIVINNGSSTDNAIARFNGTSGELIQNSTVLIDDSGNMSMSGNLTVIGDLYVSGTTTTINTEDLAIKDNMILLNSGETGSSVTAGVAGIEIDRGSGNNVILRYNDSGTNRWQFTNDGSNYEDIPIPSEYTNNTGTVESVSITGTDGIDVDSGSPITGTGTITLGLSSIPNSSLLHSNITIGSTAISLGSSSLTLAGLSSVSSTSFTGALTGNATSSDKWSSSMTITLGGDLTGNVSFDGSTNVTLTSTIASSSVEASMLNNNVISGLNALTSGLVSTDELMISDTNVSTIKRMDISVLETYMQSNLTFTGLTNGTVTSVSAGNGMTFTTITSTGSVIMGTPGTITASSSNSVSTNSHTHTLDESGISITYSQISNLSSWTGSSSITTLGTISTGVWQGTAINQTYLVGQSGTNTGDQTISLTGPITGSGTGSFATTITANAVKDTHIDWGTSTNQVSTADIPEQTNLYYTEARVSANTNVAANTSARHNALTLHSSATAGGLSLSTQVLSFRAATNAQTGYATAAQITAIEANTLKNTNVSTQLSVGTKTSTTFGITSDGGTDDVVLIEATTTYAGLLGADKWDEIVANTLKNTNVTQTITLTGPVTGSGTGSFATTITANAVKDTHIDWGTGANQVSTADIPEQTNLYYTETRVNTNTNVAANTSARHNAVTLNANATAGGLGLSTQQITFRAATNAQTGYATDAHITAIEANTLKNTNVSTTLSTGTRNATTYGITSDGGTDDIILLEATTSLAGLLGADKWDEIVANTLKNTNVSTQLSIGTKTSTTFGITSDGSANDVVLIEATTTYAGLLGADKWDEIVANSLKNTNVSTALSTGTRNSTTYGITSDGSANDVILLEATTSLAGLLGADKWDEIVANTSKNTNVSTQLSLGTKTTTTIAITSDGSVDDVILPEATTATAGLLGADKWDEIVANTLKNTNVPTNLTTTHAATTVTINSSDGTNAQINGATASLAGVITNADQTFSGEKTFNDELFIDEAGLSYGENLDVDSGTQRVIAQVAANECTAIFFDYSIMDSSIENLRAGTVVVSHDQNGDFRSTETSTSSVGDTSDVALVVDIDSGYVRLLAETQSNNWKIKTLIRKI